MFGLPSLLFLVRYSCEQQEGNLDTSHQCFTWRSVRARLLHCHLYEELLGADDIALFRIVITNKTTMSREYRRWQPAFILWRGIRLCTLSRQEGWGTLSAAHVLPRRAMLSSALVMHRAVGSELTVLISTSLGSIVRSTKRPPYEVTGEDSRCVPGPNSRFPFLRCASW